MTNAVNSRRGLAGGVLWALLLSGTVLTVAQARPSFSGNWVLVKEEGQFSGRGAAAEGPSTLSCGNACTIRQSPSTLVVERSYGKEQFVTTVNLDGSETTSSNQMGGVPIDVSARASWDGSRLVVTTKSNPSQNPVTVRLTLVSDQLVTETERLIGPARELRKATRTYKRR